VDGLGLKGKDYNKQRLHLFCGPPFTVSEQCEGFGSFHDMSRNVSRIIGCIDRRSVRCTILNVVVCLELATEGQIVLCAKTITQRFSRATLRVGLVESGDRPLTQPV
jgi:hypothetical protein